MALGHDGWIPDRLRIKADTEETIAKVCMCQKDFVGYLSFMVCLFCMFEYTKST